MALSTVTVTVTNTDVSQKFLTVYGTIAISASPGTYATGGLALSWLGFDQIKSGSLPTRVYIQSQPSTAAANSFVYGYVNGTSLANGKIQVFTGAAAQTGLTELSAAATPAGVSGDTIVFEAVFPSTI